MIVVRLRPTPTTEEREYRVYGLRRVAVMMHGKRGLHETDLTCPSELKARVLAEARRIAGDNSTGAVDAAPPLQQPSRKTKVLRR